MAGIRGLQGVVRKTVNDELQANIWDPQHMDKIVPSLLFNLQSEEGTERYAGRYAGLLQVKERNVFQTCLITPEPGSPTFFAFYRTLSLVFLPR